MFFFFLNIYSILGCKGSQEISEIKWEYNPKIIASLENNHRFGQEVVQQMRH